MTLAIIIPLWLLGGFIVCYWFYCARICSGPDEEDIVVENEKVAHA